MLTNRRDAEPLLWHRASVAKVANPSREARWADDELVRLHGHLLEKSLRDLFDARVSAATRAEILEWMRSPRDRWSAFSYLVCCAVFGFDPQDIRERVLERYQQHQRR
jgi:hypothetical protein